MSGAGLVITAILMLIIGATTGFTICAVFWVESFNNDLEELNEELRKALKREEDLHKQLEKEKEERERQ